MALSFLDYLLTGTSAAPLVRALNDSGLGESITGGGVEDTLRQPVYSMGLKGVKPDDVEKVRTPFLLYARCGCSGHANTFVRRVLQ